MVLLFRQIPNVVGKKTAIYAAIVLVVVAMEEIVSGL